MGLQYFDVQICVFYGNLTDKTSFFFKNISIRIYKIHSYTTNVYYILYSLKFHDTMNFEYLKELMIIIELYVNES